LRPCRLGHHSKEVAAVSSSLAAAVFRSGLAIGNA
jgi:hypothetical protein